MLTLDGAMDAGRVDHLIRVYRDGLLEDTLPFWLRHGADAGPGGIMTCLDRDGSVLDTDKGVWQQGRFAWMLGRAWHAVERRPEWLEAAADTLRFVEAHCIDADGRMFFHVTRDGRPIRKRRYALSEAFAAVGFGEHARAAASDHSRNMAERLYHVFDAHVPDPPKWCGTRPMTSLAGPMIRIFVCQSLRESIGLGDADARIDRAIAEIRRDFMKPELRCCMENVGPSGGILDHDWFGYFHRDGRLSSPIKGNLYNGCFHLPRQQLVCWRIAEEIRQGRVGRFKAAP